MNLMMMERVGDGEEKIEGSFSTGQSLQRALVPVEEEEEDYYCDIQQSLETLSSISISNNKYFTK
jgi:hypothetical protein